MSNVAGVILACKTAVSTAMTNAGIPTFNYSTVELPNNPPVATLTTDGLTLRRFDQTVGIATVKLLMEVYHLLEGNAATAQANADAAVATTIVALGADPTLGGSVVSVDLGDEPGQHFETRPGANYVVWTWSVEVEPFANAA